MPPLDAITRIRDANANVERLLLLSSPAVRQVAVEFVENCFRYLNEIQDVDPQAGIICQQYLQTRLAMKNMHDVDKYLEAVQALQKARNGN